MADNRNYAALDWVIDEIQETLKEARQSLEAFVEDAQDTAQIGFCTTYIHQVKGGLEMIEYVGAATLAEEMETLSVALKQNDVSFLIDAQEALMRALLQLPIYLQHCQSNRKDDLSVVLPLLNDLRASKGEPLYSEGGLFNPDLSLFPPAGRSRHPVLSDAQKLKAASEKLRKMFQYAAAGVMRGVDFDNNAAYMLKATERMEQIATGAPRKLMWSCISALAQAIADGSIEISVSVKTLLRRIDKEFRLVIVHGAKAIAAKNDEGLIKNLLYYLGRCDSQAPRVIQLKSQFLLDQPSSAAGGVLQDELTAAPDAATFKTIARALEGELDQVKNILDQAIEGSGQADVAESLPILQRIADTFTVLEAHPLRELINQQRDALESLIDQGVTRDGLLQIADRLVSIEQRLGSVADTTKNDVTVESLLETDDRLQISRAQESVLREARNGLEQTKDSIIEFIASQWDGEHLAAVPGILDAVKGALNIIPLPGAAAVLGSCRQYIQKRLIGDEATVSWGDLDTLADAIAGVEYYLERIGKDSEEDRASVLELAEGSVAKLGFPVEVSDTSSDETESSVEAEQQVELVVSEPSDELATLADEADQLADLPTPEASLEIDGAEGLVEFKVTDEETEVPTESINETAEAASADQPDIPDSSLVTAEESSHQVDADVTEERAALEVAPEAGESDDEDIVDDEIIEIFIEEAGEVLVAIDEFYPKWASDFSDQDSLGEFRRAFHTLKGSGRMVGAEEIGELAWSIENMLNRVIDGTAEVSEPYSQIIGKVRSILPEMIEAFKTGTSNPRADQARAYRQWAEQLADGQIPSDFGEEPQAEIVQITEVDEAADKVSVAEELVATEVSDSVIEGNTAPVMGDSAVIEDDDDGEDEQDRLLMHEIFVSEAETHLAAVREFVDGMEKQRPLYEPPSDSVQRALHTLKGSAHMAEMTEIAKLATPLERFLKELRAYQVRIDDDILDLLKDGVDYIDENLEPIRMGGKPIIPKLEIFIARVAELRERSVAPLIRQKELAEPGSQRVDPELLSIFMAEEMTLLLDAEDVLSLCREDSASDEVVGALIQELRTLAKGAEHAHLPPMSNLSQTLANVHEHFQGKLLTLETVQFDALKEGHEKLLDMVDCVAAGQTLEDINAVLSKSLEDLTAVPQISEEDFSEVDSDTFETSDNESINDVAEDLADTIDDAISIELNETELLEAVDFDDLEVVGENQLVEEGEQRDQIHQEATVDSVTGSDLAAVEEQPAEHSSEEVIEEVIEEEVTEPFDSIAEDADVEEEAESEADTSAVTSHFVSDTETTSEDIADEDIDPEILEIFIEEANELTEEIESSIHDWEEDWSNSQAGDELKRSLHTFKGGARLAGLMGLGELAHNFETYLIQQTDKGNINADFFQKVHDFQDQLLKATGQVKSSLEGDSQGMADIISAQDPNVETVLDAAALGVDLEESSPARESELEGQSEQPSTSTVIPFQPNDNVPVVSGEGFSLPAPGATSPTPAKPAADTGLAGKRSAPQEVVKVSADLMEELVNLAGETSISRARMEEQVSDMGFVLEEMDSTLLRLQEQLRRLDIETEAQILFRQEQLSDSEEFDPLEMDRYSQLQQLSRSLIESASDLLDLKTTMKDKNRDSETLLLQQSRINTDLQEGLMRSRMVPFSRLIPRLRRIVRQAASELGKQVNFELENIEGELDRTVLERMVAPLEHMLRNAVDHGIETPEERVSVGKDQIGRIILSVQREGADVVLRLIDDGRGIKLDRVRQKAIDLGLMAEGAVLSDQDVMHFILHAGFTTADKVTQISGRGVGMDVVNTEIKQVGGSVAIDSNEGEGTQFTVRLPFTVSVNRALMIRIGDDRYAIPLNTIEGIVRISPFELEHYYQNPEARFEYAGDRYQVRYMGDLLNSDVRPKLEGQIMPLPVVLVRSATNTVAIHVDMLMGSREIVVKSLGAQFASVLGLSGATVMGDGSVVVILDPHALIRKEAALEHLHSQALESKGEQYSGDHEKTVMVVDDSVTVRKVTSRLLEREGYNVITAKDGADAMQQLQDHMPDIMLLDIEMPRMDGFEVAKNVRSSSRLKSLPIIMITSRTGSKHRERALDLGVNRYMGKPYQEDMLLENIKNIVEA